MMREELSVWAGRYGLRCIENRVMGSWKGYPFSAVLKEGRVSTLTVTFALLKGPKGGDLKRLRRELPKGCALSGGGARLILVCSGGEESLTGLATTGLDETAALLRETGSAPSDQCPLCKQRNCDSLALVGGDYVPVHRACCEAHAGEAVAKAEINALSGSYLTGWIGAILGGLAAAIPSILLAWFAERISAWLYALIPLGAYYGYKLLKGRMNRMATVATIVSSLLQVFLIDQILCYIAIVVYWHIWPSPFDSMRFFFQNIESGDIAASLVQSLLFLALGLFIVFRIVTRTNQHETHDAGILADSLTEWRPAGTASAPTASTWDERGL